MTVHSLTNRLQRLERSHGIADTGRTYTEDELRRMPDAQLEGLIRSDYRQMVDEHGSLAAAAAAYREVGQPELAEFIEQEIHQGRRDEPIS